MTDDGLEYSTDMTDLTSKVNRKSCVVGTGTQLNSLVTTYPGMRAFCTSTGSGFTVNKTYMRNSANDAWLPSPPIETSTEYTSTPVTDDDQVALGVNVTWYYFITLPTTEEFYIFTSITYKGGSINAGNVICGVRLVDANPPVDQNIPLIAWTNSQTQASGLVTLPVISSAPVRGGTTVGLFVTGTNSTQTYRIQTGLADQNNRKTDSSNTNPQNNDNGNTWSTGTSRVYLSATYKGYIPT